MNPYSIALLIYFLKAVQRNTDLLPTKPETSYALTDVLEQANTSVDYPSKDICFEVYFSATRSQSIEVDFKIGRKGSTFYVVKNISEFCARYQRHTLQKFGKKLELILTEGCFADEAKKIMDFLIRLSTGTDMYAYSYDRDTRSVRIERKLELSGSYLEELIELLPKSGCYINGKNKMKYPFKMENGLPKYEANIHQTATKGVFRLQIEAPTLVKGVKNLYYLDESKGILYFSEIDQNYLLLNQLSSRMEDKDLYITEKDMTLFSSRILPALEEKGSVKSATDLSLYRPLKPKFEFYLDMPQKNWITCKVNAVYPDFTHSVFEPKAEAQRNLDEEKQIDHLTSPWFEAFNPNEKYLSLQSEDKIYALLTEGIPFLQTLGKVFISDELKKLKTKKMQRVQVGVSVSRDLLQLNLINDQKTLEELAEILSKYEPKKKYYRLKNGEFIGVEESDIAEFAQMMEDLQISSKQVQKGEVSVPKYRAMYLDRIAEEELEMERDTTFRALID